MIDFYLLFDGQIKSNQWKDLWILNIFYIFLSETSIDIRMAFL